MFVVMNFLFIPVYSVSEDQVFDTPVSLTFCLLLITIAQILLGQVSI